MTPNNEKAILVFDGATTTIATRIVQQLLTCDCEEVLLAGTTTVLQRWWWLADPDLFLFWGVRTVSTTCDGNGCDLAFSPGRTPEVEKGEAVLLVLHSIHCCLLLFHCVWLVLRVNVLLSKQRFIGIKSRKQKEITLQHENHLCKISITVVHEQEAIQLLE
ncbi:hypothetical protein BDF20DRAFT_987460 [Mycotypha africana]|uniref:uncharacterized protein n=1 Tax=Mycotypha africana TaxID=64632 RepID=UPI002300468A|nr:uncharacterized protein BDF20DRAFT_987460 [Mycotypha africana]KAI8979148.1 hypothetical protein BDF20DRAFT_987460 [Mycotypha africana]